MSLPIKSLVPLLASAGLLFFGNGLMTTILALRARTEGFVDFEIGMVSAAYFVGSLFASLFTGKIITRVGYVRTFAAMAALTAICILMLVVYVDPFFWVLVRGVMGFGLFSLFIVNESWLNDAADDKVRGRILALYRIVDFSAVILSQFAINLFSLESYVIFSVSACLFCLAIMPITLSPSTQPRTPTEVRYDILKILRLSPLAVTSCAAIGVSNSVFRTLGPVYADSLGLGLPSITLFMAAGIAGGVLTQYPMGYLSDHYDRRKIVLIATLGAMASSALMTYFGPINFWMLLLGVTLFGSFSLPIFSLAAALANDRADSDMRLNIAAALLFVYILGGAFGTLGAGLMSYYFGPEGIFLLIAIVHGLFAGVSIWRLIVRDAVPKHLRKPLVVLSRTSAAHASLAKGDKRKIKKRKP